MARLWIGHRKQGEGRLTKLMMQIWQLYGIGLMRDMAAKGPGEADLHEYVK